MRWLVWISLISLFTPNTVLAADAQIDALKEQFPELEDTELRGAIGARYWYSQSSASTNNSTYTASSIGGHSHSAEFEGVLENVVEDVELEGVIGYGMTSDDVATHQFYYARVGAGWELGEVLDGAAVLSIPFGYRYLHDAYGIQTGATTATQSFDAHLFRLGIAATAEPLENLAISGEVVLIPYGFLSSSDGDGDYVHGLEAELFASYAFTDAISFGLGARYWYLNSDLGHASGDLDFDYHRYGLLLEGVYEF